MRGDPAFSTEGWDPAQTADRLGALIDKMIQKCPDAVIIVASIIPTCRSGAITLTEQFQALVPGIVQTRFAAGHKVAMAGFNAWPTSKLRDCIHPTDDGYDVMGDWWYDFITQIPSSWWSAPQGPDPVRDLERNGGINENIPPLDWGTSPIVDSSNEHIAAAANGALEDGDSVWSSCKRNPHWYSTGKLASGRGVEGEHKFHVDWNTGHEILPATGLDPEYVRCVNR